MAIIPARYTDANTTEATTIDNDGKTLRMTIRGVEFTCSNFDAFWPPENAAPDQLRSFSLHRGYLCSCQIACEMSVPIHDNGKDSSGILAIELKLGGPAGNLGLESEELSIALRYQESIFEGSGRSGWFEDELLEIQQQLPDGTYIRACINCLYSDYSPFGHSTFGDMMCFRNLKEEYLKVKSKDQFWPVHDRCDLEVQETFLCDEFKRRIPGTGYRG